MPSIQDNLDCYDRSYDWSRSGEEWSRYFGGTELMWTWTILPRISSYLPVENMLEIAPGFGRVTQFLAPSARNLTVVDLSNRCIEACKNRFAEYEHITYAVNDGRSLNMIEDGSVDFVFSWDSMVHVEADVIEAYLNQLAVKLRPGGVGFIHHSNLNMYSDPRRGASTLLQEHRRAHSMSATRFRGLCKRAGLSCRVQELLPWAGAPALLDCVSVFRREAGIGKILCRTTKVIKNHRFVEQIETRPAVEIRKIAKMYQLPSLNSVN